MRLMKNVLSLTAAAAFLVPAAAQAQLPSEGSIVFQSASAYYNGVGVGPYVGSVPGFPTIDIFCVDFAHHASRTPWTARFTNLATGDISQTRWGSLNSDNYQKAAWLATQFYSNPTSSWGEIHAAIWHLFNPNLPSWSTSATDSYWHALADANYQNLDSQYWYIATDLNTDLSSRDSYNMASGGRQEYLVHVTPEPSSLILLGSGLLGVGLVVQRRRKRSR